MTISDLRKDLDSGTLTIETEYDASPERLWRLWADPRQLERWWGPPGYPATVTDHDMSVGGVVRYFMTSPEGDKHHGGWQVVAADPPNRLEFQDFFANADGTENTGLPRSHSTIRIEPTGSGTTRMLLETRYDTSEDLAKVLEMGMEEGIKAALGQIEALLQEG